MNLEEKVLAYRELFLKINELEETKKALSAEILTLMPSESETIQVENLKVKRYSRLNIKTSLETARTLKATKMEEVVDKDHLKKLISQGILIDGVTESTFIIVSAIKESNFTT